MKKTIMFVSILFISLAMIVPATAFADRMDLKGKKFTVSILGIAGWYPAN